MTADNWLFAFIICVVALAIWLLVASKVTPEERDAMLRDEEMWP